MLKQIKLLTKIQLLGAFGFNEARYSKDKKLKNRNIGMMFAFAFLGLILAGYSAALTFAYVKTGLQEIIPVYLSAITSIIILVFTVIKAGDTIFSIKSYDSLIVLPVHNSSIVLSRFLMIYILDVVFSLLIFLPSTIVSGVMLKYGVSYYIMMLVGAVFMPLIPLSIATAIGGLIYGVSSRMKHKNIAVIIFSLIATLAVIVAPMLLTGNVNIDEIQLAQMSAVMFQKIGGIFPPAILFSNSVVNGSWLLLLLFCFISIACAALFISIIGMKFKSICTALQSTAAKRDFVMENQKNNSQLKALYNKELKRYFASSIYVLNTSIGYIMSVLLGVTLLIMGADKLEQMLGGFTLPFWAFPLILSVCFGMMPTTTSSISIEGKQWWIVKSLPVSTKNVFDSKLLVNLTIALPCWLVSTVLILIALRPTALETVWLIVLPLAFLMFSSVFGLTANAKNPMFNWESETVVVKQSKAGLLSMLFDFAAIAVQAAVLILLPSTLVNLWLALITAALVCIAIILYRKNNKMDLSKIN